MPLRPGVPCGVPRCGHLQPCSVHPKRCLSDRLRGSQSQRGLGTRQAKWRVGILGRDVLCRGCGGAPSTHADHIIPRKPGAEDWSEENGQGLCGAPGPIGPLGACHSFKTAREQRDPFLGIRLREEGAKIGEPAPQGWRYLTAFGGGDR